MKKTKSPNISQVCLHTQNPRPFPGFAVVVVVVVVVVFLFDEILDDFYALFSECVTVFRRKVRISVGRETQNTHFAD